MNRRIILLIIILLTSAYLPWWVSATIALISIWRYSSSYELLLPALLVDLAYATPIFGSLRFAFPVTLLLIIILAVNKILARQLFFRSL